MWRDAVKVVIDGHKASTSLLQRRLRVGYARAARLIESMEEQGIVGPADGARPREV
jgi:S-DNA-T family DNA segregation ATPase FtsK/SpoIIIE